MQVYRIEIEESTNRGPFKRYDVCHITAERRKDAINTAFDWLRSSLELKEMAGSIKDLYCDAKTLTAQYKTVCRSDGVCIAIKEVKRMHEYRIEIMGRANSEGMFDQYDVIYIMAERRKDAIKTAFERLLDELKHAEEAGLIRDLFYDCTDLSVNYKTVCNIDNWCGYNAGDVIDSVNLVIKKHR